MEITQQYLHECFCYNKDTGALSWRKRPESHFGGDIRRTKISNTKAAGSVVSTSHNNGKGKLYYRVKLDGKYYLVHRVIWMWVYGEWPDVIDHINGNGTDNRLANLRSVSIEENNRNLKRCVNNTSGVTGVTKFRSRWVAHIWGGNKQINLGSFDTFEEAVAARKAAEITMGYHENHGSDSKSDAQQ